MQVGVQLIAVTAESEQIHKQFLGANGIPLPRIVKLEASGLPVSGTPTLVLVSNNGRVLKSWVGKLTDLEEQEVMRSLSESTRGKV